MAFVQTELGLAACERFEAFKLEALSELILRLVGGLTVVGATMLWLITPIGEFSAELTAHASLAALVTLIGVAIYALGNRGFRRQVSLDFKREVLALSRVNTNEQCRTVRSIAIDKVEGLFLRRPAGRPGCDALYIRLSGQEAPIMVLIGDTHELEHLHATLSGIIFGGGYAPAPQAAPVEDTALAHAQG